MQTIILILIILSSYTVALANPDEKKDKVSIEMDEFYEVREKVNKAFSTRSLADSYKESFLPEQNSKSFNKMIKKISDEIAVNFKERSMVSQDECTLRCANYGTSEMRKKIFFHVSTTVDLSQETRECQKVCKVYFAEYNGYFDGYKAARSEKKEAAADCIGATHSGSRTNKPGLFGVDPLKLERAIRVEPR